jgi:hypothetical protein
LAIPPARQLVPFGSDRAALAGSYRILMTSCWDAPGSNRRPPADPDLSEAAVGSRLGLGSVCQMWHQPSSLMFKAPIRESGVLPHIGHPLLRYCIRVPMPSLPQ